MPRLGAPVFGDVGDPAKWAAAHRTAGYSAAYCPVDSKADDATVKAYADAASAAGLVIAEVGAWSNTLSPDDATRKAALAHCKAQLDLADRIGARCCVNIVGSRGEQWDGPHPDNLTPATFQMVVDMVREIIDAVKPKRSVYSLETMPWMYPDSPKSYASLIKAIDRKAFGVHLDPVNIVCSPQRYYSNASLLQECFHELGRWVKSCHAKDIKLSGSLTVHLDEVRPGLGNLDYQVYLKELARLGPDVPLMVEHLPNESEYKLAVEHIRAQAAAAGVKLT